MVRFLRSSARHVGNAMRKRGCLTEQGFRQPFMHQFKRLKTDSIAGRVEFWAVPARRQGITKIPPHHWDLLRVQQHDGPVFTLDDALCGVVIPIPQRADAGKPMLERQVGLAGCPRQFVDIAIDAAFAVLFHLNVAL